MLPASSKCQFQAHGQNAALGHLEKDVVRPDITPGGCFGVQAVVACPASIVGVGGMGKTALATWATLRVYERGQFDLIVSITAKDRELTQSGIRGLDASLGSFESLLDAVLDVTGFGSEKSKPIGEREKAVRSLLTDANALLYVDNLETVDDKRIIAFLDDLPVGCRALVTSRRATVRVAVRPIDLGPMDEEEVVAYLQMLSRQPGFAYVSALAPAEMSRVGEACDGIPLAMQWALSKAESPAEALLVADGITSSGRRGEELLEFTFRRVFEAMTRPEREVLQVLSLFQRPLPTEAILVGGTVASHKMRDGLDRLLDDALVQRVFDPQINDYAYSLLPITRAFVYAELCKEPAEESRIRRVLADYFEARDISDPGQRVAIREIRQGKAESEMPLVDLARAAEREGKWDESESLYRQALTRNPRSWKAARYFAEFLRHKRRNTGEALGLYEQAAANSPGTGKDRAMIFREWGMLLRDSGRPEATELAEAKFEAALAETPNDPVARFALAQTVARMGKWSRVMELIEPLRDHPNEGTKRRVRPLLLQAYDQVGEIVKAAELRPLVGDQDSRY